MHFSSRGQRLWRTVLGLGLALLLGAGSVAAQERILDFSSTVIIDPDGSLLVSEDIAVQSDGDQIKRGIVREFPTTYQGTSGRTTRVGFTLVEVLRDGQAEPHHLETQDNGVAVYIGSRDVFLTPGVYRYRITYRTTRQLGFFDTHDELYWNVNGNGWRLPLDRVRCTVILPEGALAQGAFAYEGPAGSTDRRQYAGGQARMVFESSRPYRPGEGLTVAVSWPKGFVLEPALSMTEKMDESGPLPVLAGAVLVCLYYVLAWLKVGRDPAKGVIIPRFAPPKGFSPAMVRMLWRMKFDNTAYTAGIINMAVKGGLKIMEGSPDTLQLAARAPGNLSVGEKAVWDEFSKAGPSIVLRNTNHQVINRARQAMRDRLSKELSTTYFKTNSAWIAPGVMLTIVALLGTAWAVPQSEVVFFLCVWLTGWTFGCFMLVRQAWRGWQARGVMGKVGALVLTAMAVPFVGAELTVLGFLISLIGVTSGAAILAMVCMNALFYELLKAPTLIGRQLLDEIEGFRLYLSVAEADRLNFIHPPEETPELFEKFLPYALALGVENQWGERFAATLSRSGYEPQWYSGSAFRTGSPGGFASSLGSDLGSSISSASSAPGSSSGSGGGGSSGGGGGGGGGGGW